MVRVRVNGQMVPRSLAQLSGGERRRVALALALGFADLIRSRGRLSSNLLVLDGMFPHSYVMSRWHWSLNRNERVLLGIDLPSFTIVNIATCVEALQQLDGEGCARVAAVLKGLPHDTVLVVGQANSYVTQVFDVIDLVIKQAGTSLIQID